MGEFDGEGRAYDVGDCGREVVVAATVARHASRACLFNESRLVKVLQQRGQLYCLRCECTECKCRIKSRRRLNRCLH